MTGALRRIGWAVLTAFLVATGAVAETCREDAVLLRGDWGQARFGVEVADTGGERARGLMHRENLPKSRGMLFVYQKVGYVAFWMKNTLIPLDMIFLDETGTVVKVHHEAQPLDPTVIPGGDNIKAVLEINGGLARDMGIAEGSEMRHPSFGKAAAWPCD